MKTRIVSLLLFIFLLGTSGISCCNVVSNNSERYCLDNCSLDYSQWNHWYVERRVKEGYYLLQYLDDGEIKCHLIFWKEKSMSDAIMIRFPKSEMIYTVSLGNLPKDSIWLNNYDSILRYQSLYDIIQHAYNYEIDKISIDGNNITIVVAGETMSLGSSQ